MAKRTPLYDNHVKHDGKMVEFAGYELPIQYAAGLVNEHNAVRNAAGLFDVSHMGELVLTGKGAEATVQNLITNDISDMACGQVKYTLMLNDKGGQVDDLLVYKITPEYFLLVVNAANTDKDAKWVESHLLPQTQFENTSEKVAQLALQGPNAEKILALLSPPDSIPTKYYTFIDHAKICGKDALISRTGYTGEDGFEIYCCPSVVGEIFEAIIKEGSQYGLLPCGLGCRDTLRFEACLPLYGHELSEDFLGTEVSLGIFLKMNKPSFIGKQALEQTPAQWKRKGVVLVDKGIAREGSKVFADGQEIGYVTTGTLSPTLGKAIAMVRIRKDFEGEFVELDVRGRRLKAQVVKMPFYRRPA